ncbi:helix-turn-helix domain-containing protein [Streptomyces fildesensis]|uniref:helix-turn-helix domain-containing protein n=1 Tax=Streptomyces fildesensis TaxID=375757 RepID=UPI0018DF3B94|nr:helix-turn-helix transcriptional regulator [Streptomyces fildesensis]
MKPLDWSAQLTARVATAIRGARKAAKLTVAELAEGCAALGLPVAGTTITNLENGRRHSVDLAEFLVLARVLGIPPIILLYPLGTAGTVEVMPGEEVSTWDAAAWFTGEEPIATAAAQGTPRDLLDTFRSHSDAVAAARVSTNLAKDRRQKANVTLDPARRETLLETAAGYEQLAFDDCRELHQFRSTMRERGLMPPALPAALAFIDDIDSGKAK